MKYFVVALFFSFLVVSSNGCSNDRAAAQIQAGAEAVPVAEKAQPGEQTPGFTTFEDAFAKAKANDKLIFVDVYTNWCGWCKKMDHDVYPDQKVQAELAKYFTAVKLNAESTDQHTFKGTQLTEQQIANQWSVQAYPTLIFLNANGDVIERVPGYIKAEEFPLVLRFIGTGAYKQTKDYQSWKKTQSL